MNPPLVFAVAGEPSGDALGAGLIAALRRRAGGRVAFAGVGGERMAAEGLDSLFPMADLSVMGFAEVLPRVPRLLRRLRQTAAAVRARRPDIVVTIDSPGFNMRLARRLRGFDRPLIHYVAPTVWAWRPGRARTMAALFDHLLALLPFEPPWFERAGLPCTFIGHPAVEESRPADGAGFRRRRGVAPGAPLLAVLPGSRAGEVRRLLPVYLAAAGELAARTPGLRFVVATVPPVAAAVENAPWPAPPIVARGAAERRDAFAAADAAIATSGTVTLELAAARTPMVICYRLSPATFAIARRMVAARLFGLANLVLGRPAIPELIQSACTPGAVAGHVRRLLADPEARAAQIDAMDRAVAVLRGPDSALTPTERAANIVFDSIGKERRKTDVRRRRLPHVAHHAPGSRP